MQVTAALLAVTMGILRIHEDVKQNKIVEITNHVALGFVTGALYCDVVKMNFGLDPAVADNATLFNFTKNIITK